MKTALKTLVPIGFQVPVKYWTDRLRGFAEPEMALLTHIVRKGDQVVDVGGNRGVYAYHCWKLGAMVNVFEPNPVCLSVLSAWAEGRERIKLNAVGLSNHGGSAELHIPIDSAGVEHDASASLEQHDFDRERTQAVSLATLDGFGLQGVRFLKIDVEGHESRVIEGASATLVASCPAILVEIEQRHCADPIADVFERISLFGYVGYYFEGGRLKPIGSFNVLRHQAAGQLGHKDGSYINNFLFLHASRLAAGEYPGLEAIGASR